jgi:hypothetical protein
MSTLGTVRDAELNQKAGSRVIVTATNYGMPMNPTYPTSLKGCFQHVLPRGTFDRVVSFNFPVIDPILSGT